MKNIRAISAAALLLATSAPAFAAPTAGDGLGYFEIKGSAGSFCLLGQTTGTENAGGDRNVTVTTDHVVASGGGALDGSTGSDANISINNLQNNGDVAGNPVAGFNTSGDSIAAWRAVFNLRHTICNAAYTVSAASLSGGLQYQGTSNGTAPFVKKVPYSVQASFDGRDGTAKQARTLVGGGNLLTSGQASVGDLKLVFDGAADHAAFLLNGDYTDQVIVTIAPTV